MIKVALLGVGGISGAHIPSWKKVDGAELVAMCDIRPECTEKYIKDGIHVYTTFEEMAKNEHIDILDICLPTYLHVEYSIRAMELGMNVICEKPISLNRDDVQKVYKAAKDNNVKYMVAHVLRFWPEFVFLKDAIYTKKYGKLFSGHMFRLGNKPLWSWDDWMADEKRSGLVPFDLHIHDLDFIIYALGKPSKMITHRQKNEKSDFINAVYDFPDGSFITADSAWYNCKYSFSSGFRFQFENAVVEYRGGLLTVYEEGKEPVAIQKGTDGEGCINLPATNAYYEEIQYFFNCVKENKPVDVFDPSELETVLDLIENFN